MLFSLPPDDSHTPLYMQITRHLKQQIRTGALPAHAKLPSKRSLAEHLGVSVTTVESAYSQLVSEGFVESRPKRGFFVCEIEPLLPAAAEPARPAAKADGGAACGFFIRRHRYAPFPVYHLASSAARLF